MTDSSPSNSLALGGFPITAVRLKSRLELKSMESGLANLKTSLSFFNKSNNHKSNLWMPFYIGNRTKNSPDKGRISS